MQNSPTPGGTEFDRLLSATPAIAEAVKQFEDPEIRRAMFDALIRTGSFDSHEAVPTSPAELTVVRPAPDAGAGESSSSPAPEGKAGSAAPRPPRTRKQTAKKSWSRIKDINFRPAGKTSLRDFAMAKDPANNHERNLVAVYYLETALEISSVEVGHVLAAYSECGWKAPAIPDNSLMVTSSQRDWLDTSNMKAIRTTLRGQNHVEFDMPAKKANSA